MKLFLLMLLFLMSVFVSASDNIGVGVDNESGQYIKMLDNGEYSSIQHIDFDSIQYQLNQHKSIIFDMVMSKFYRQGSIADYKRLYTNGELYSGGKVLAVPVG